MLSLGFNFGKNVFKQSHLRSVINIVQQRTFFQEFETKLERFDNIGQNYRKENRNIEECRTIVNRHLSEKLNLDDNFMQNLLRIIYLGNTNEENDLILKSLIRYTDENNSFKFHSLLIRRLYKSNQIDTAIDYFKDQKLRKIFTQDLTSVILVLDKLIEEKRFADAVKFYDDHVTSIPKIPSSILNAITLCLLKINTLESYKKCKILTEFADKKRLKMGINSIVHIFMFAINQKDYIYALQFLAKRDKIHQNLFNNLLAIVHACLDQVEDSIDYAFKAVKLNDGYLFQTTLKHIEDARTRHSNTEIEKKFEDLKTQIDSYKTGTKVKNEDLLEFYSKSTEGIYTKTFRKFKQ